VLNLKLFAARHFSAKLTIWNYCNISKSAVDSRAGRESPISLTRPMRPTRSDMVSLAPGTTSHSREMSVGARLERVLARIVRVVRIVGFMRVVKLTGLVQAREHLLRSPNISRFALTVDSEAHTLFMKHGTTHLIVRYNSQILLHQYQTVIHMIRVQHESRGKVCIRSNKDMC